MQPSVTGTFTTVTGAQITPSTAFTVDYTAPPCPSSSRPTPLRAAHPVLAASNVSAPTAPNTSPSPGQPVSATFKVTNTGTGTAEGPWNDSVYVGTSSTYSSSDALLERIPQTSNIGPGDSYDVTVQAFLPPLPAGGNYQLIRRARQRREGVGSLRGHPGGLAPLRGVSSARSRQRARQYDGRRRPGPLRPGHRRRQRRHQGQPQPARGGPAGQPGRVPDGEFLDGAGIGVVR